MGKHSIETGDSSPKQEKNRHHKCARLVGRSAFVLLLSSGFGYLVMPGFAGGVEMISTRITGMSPKENEIARAANTITEVNMEIACVGGVTGYLLDMRDASGVTLTDKDNDIISGFALFPDKVCDQVAAFKNDANSVESYNGALAVVHEAAGHSMGIFDESDAECAALKNLPKFAESLGRTTPLELTVWDEMALHMQRKHKNYYDPVCFDNFRASLLGDKG